jgi:methenyltetrahydrofolate cyclohydrolase
LTLETHLESRAAGSSATLLDLPTADLLDRVAAETPTPGSGFVAALVVAQAASLVAMSARFSDKRWDEAGGVVAQAEALTARATPLAQADADAYEAALATMRAARDQPDGSRDEAIGNALSRAAEIPLAIAETALDVAELGALVCERGNPNLVGDAQAGVILAEAAARAAANLVAINLATTSDDDRIAQAERLAAGAANAMRRALRATP